MSSGHSIVGAGESKALTNGERERERVFFITLETKYVQSLTDKCVAFSTNCALTNQSNFQAVMDRINASNPLWEVDESCDNAWTINILLFDILSFGTDKNFMKDACTVTERYELLRSLQDPVMQVISPESSIKVQWAGHLKALVEFDCTNRDTLPHIVDCYLRLGWKDPSTVRLLKRTVDKMDCESEEEDIGNGGVV